MFSRIFLVCGYGVPKDIMSDGNYQRYFAAIYGHLQMAIRKRPGYGELVFSGGPTDMFPPYRRRESHEMRRLMRLIDQAGDNWLRGDYLRFREEGRALSTLENLVFTKRRFGSDTSTELTVFCEYTRRAKVGLLARHVFAGAKQIRVVPIDFDQSANRHLDRTFIRNKERLDIKVSLWALESERNMLALHSLLKRKIEILRESGPENHTEALRRFWEEALEAVAEGS